MPGTCVLQMGPADGPWTPEVFTQGKAVRGIYLYPSYWRGFLQCPQAPGVMSHVYWPCLVPGAGFDTRLVPSAGREQGFSHVSTHHLPGGYPRYISLCATRSLPKTVPEMRELQGNCWLTSGPHPTFMDSMSWHPVLLIQWLTCETEQVRAHPGSERALSTGIEPP